MLVLEFESELCLFEILLKLLQSHPKLASIPTHVIVAVDVVLRPFGQQVKYLRAWLSSGPFELGLGEIFLDLLELLIELVIQLFVVGNLALRGLQLLVDSLLKRCHARLLFLNGVAALDSRRCHLSED